MRYINERVLCCETKIKAVFCLFDFLKIYIFTIVLGEYFFMSFFRDVLGIYFLFIII